MHLTDQFKLNMCFSIPLADKHVKRKAKRRRQETPEESSDDSASIERDFLDEPHGEMESQAVASHGDVTNLI